MVGLKLKRNIQAHRRIEEADYVVVDTELTGLDVRFNSIVSIGALQMTGGRIALRDSFYRLVNPRTKLSAESVIYHEITPSDVHLKPEIEEVISDFLLFCGKRIVVGYCVSLDMEFINAEKRRFSGSRLENPAIDIRSLFEWARTKEAFRDHPCSSFRENYRLYDIAECMGIGFNGSHNAMIDSYITAQIFQRLIPVLLMSGLTTTSELLKLSNRCKGGEKYDNIRNISNF